MPRKPLGVQSNGRASQITHWALRTMPAYLFRDMLVKLELTTELAGHLLGVDRRDIVDWRATEDPAFGLPMEAKALVMIQDLKRPAVLPKLWALRERPTSDIYLPDIFEAIGEQRRAGYRVAELESFKRRHADTVTPEQRRERLAAIRDAMRDELGERTYVNMLLDEAHQILTRGVPPAILAQHELNIAAGKAKAYPIIPTGRDRIHVPPLYVKPKPGAAPSMDYEADEADTIVVVGAPPARTIHSLIYAPTADLDTPQPPDTLPTIFLPEPPDPQGTPA